jgi:hypothetical protein
MELALPEELSDYHVHKLIEELKDRYPIVFADCVDIFKISPLHKMLILDTMLMDHPDLYLTLFRPEPER